MPAANMSHIAKFPTATQLGYGARAAKPSPSIPKGSYFPEKIVHPAELTQAATQSYQSAASAGASASHIDPAYVIGGVAAAGVGAAAVNAYTNNEKESALDTVANGVTKAADTTVGVVSTAATVLNLGTLPLMLGALAMPALTLPAAGLSKLGWHAPLNGMEKLGSNLGKAMSYTVGNYGDKLNRMTGHDVSGILGRTTQKMADATANNLAPALNTISKVPGFSGMHAENIRTLPKQISASGLAHTAMNGAMLTSSAVSLYGVARDFGGQLVALRQLAADIQNKPLSAVSSFEVLTSSSLPKSVLEARGKLLSLSGIHALADMASVGVILNTHRMGMMMGMLAWSAPEQIHQMGASFIGESALPYYKGLRDAQAAGQQLSSEAIAELILAANAGLRDRGTTGKHFAAELANQYVAEGTKVALIVDEVSNGGMKKRIEAITEAHKKPAVAEAPAEVAAAPAEISHVERLQQKPLPPLQVAVRPEIGAFTSKINQQAALAAEKSATQAI